MVVIFLTMFCQKKGKQVRGFFPALPVNLFFLLFPVFSFLNKIILAYFGRKCKKYLALSFNKYKGGLLYTPFTVTLANPFKIRFANGICSHLNHFLTDFAVNAKSCVNSNKGGLLFMGAGKSGHTERCASGKAWAETHSRSAWNLAARSRKSSR